VVFFGENVPAQRVNRAMEALESASALLVAGSSLMVFSGFRFARAARRLSLPLVIVNRGQTRADELATLRIDGDVAQVWAYYTFHRNQQFSHCGVDAFMLLKVGTEWKITQLADSRRTEGCTHQTP